MSQPASRDRVTCPSDNDLARAVEATETVPPELAAHLETCVDCQKELDQLTAGSKLIGYGRYWEALGMAPDETAVQPGSSTPGPGQVERADPGGQQGEYQFAEGMLGTYRVLRKLGQGGMGQVHEAEDTLLKRRVALKLINPGAAANHDYRLRFLREAQAVARVSHDHICPIYQVGESGGIPYIAMPLLEGETLEQRLQREPLDLESSLEVLQQAAEGLAEAHAAGLIHRDLKPSNIWLEQRSGGIIRVRLLDFGLARCDHDDTEAITLSGTIVGTPSYMAPEQARGETVDQRADLFSLGAIAWEMIAGMRAFCGPGAIDVLSRILHHEPEFLSRRDPGVSESLSRLVEQLLKKSAAERTSSSRELVAQLQRIREELRTRRAGPDPDSKTSPNLRPATAAGRGAGKRGAALLAGAGLFGLLVWFGILVFRTADGTLIVEFDDSADIRVRNGLLQIHDDKGELRYTLRPSANRQKVAPGSYRVNVEGADGLTVDTERFELKRGETVVVRVAAEPPAGNGQAALATDPPPPMTVASFPGKPVVSEEFDDPRQSQVPVRSGNGAIARIAEGRYILCVEAGEAGTQLVIPVASGLQSGAFVAQCRANNGSAYFNFCSRRSNESGRYLSLAVKDGNWQLFVARQEFEGGQWSKRPATKIAYDNVVDPRLMADQWIELAARWSTEDFEVWLNGRHIASGVLPEELLAGNATPLQVCARSFTAGTASLELASVRVWDQSGIAPADAAPQGLPPR